MFVCGACGAEFSFRSNLTRHQKTALYCLSDPEGEFICQYCDYRANLKVTFLKHTEKCVLRKKIIVHEERIAELEKLIAEKDGKISERDELIKITRKNLKQSKTRITSLEKEIADLKLKDANTEGQIKVYRERPGTSNTSTQYINNKLLQVKCDTIRPFTIETVRDDIRDGKYTFERYIQAEKGLLDFIADIIFQDDQRSYVCTDSSRQRFHRLLESREWRDDNGATFLNKVLDELKELATEYYTKITDMMVNGDRELADILMNKTKIMAYGIINPKSKDRETTFAKIRNEVKKLSSI